MTGHDSNLSKGAQDEMGRALWGDLQQRQRIDMEGPGVKSHRDICALLESKAGEAT